MGGQWNYMLLPKGQVNEKQCTDLTVGKPGLNLRRKMQGNEQAVEGTKRTVGRNLAENFQPLFSIYVSVDSYRCVGRVSQ